MLKMILAALSLLVAASAFAQEAFIKRTIEERVPGFKVEGVAKTPFGGLYEVRNPDAEILYTDEKVSFIIVGNIRDGKNPDHDFTAERVKKLTAIKFEDLPLASAFKIVRGKGTRQVAYFTDPNCPYCRQIEREMQQLDDLTIHVFLYPILNLQDSPVKSRNVWCSADRAKAWNDLMFNGVQPVAAPTSCSTPIERNIALGRKMRINSVPTLVLANGERVPGMRPAAALKQMIEEAAKQGAVSTRERVAAR